MATTFIRFIEQKTYEIMAKHGAFVAFSEKQIAHCLKSNKEKGFSGDKRDYWLDSITGINVPKVNIADFETEIENMQVLEREDYLNTYSKEDIIRRYLREGRPISQVYWFGFTRDDVREVKRAILRS
ncbi:hypothetical protein vBVpaS1601_86 [Vibrio phage vB_VpaS_1601]|nr:hypothetical protein vBVpaP1601_86 [Vibrio phage vB_VpaP_1601]